jgi:Fur family ferric uptake transcriptional regulator
VNRFEELTMSDENAELRKVGLKVTTPRVKILQLLETSIDGHLSAEDIYQKLIEEGEQTGLATVYRVLTQFEAAGLVLRHNFEGGRSVFELDRGEHHDHMVCTETGTVTEFHSSEIERLQEQIAASYDYEIVGHSLVLYVRPKR